MLPRSIGISSVFDAQWFVLSPSLSAEAISTHKAASSIFVLFILGKVVAAFCGFDSCPQLTQPGTATGNLAFGLRLSQGSRNTPWPGFPTGVSCGAALIVPVPSIWFHPSFGLV